MDFLLGGSKEMHRNYYENILQFELSRRTNLGDQEHRMERNGLHADLDWKEIFVIDGNYSLRRVSAGSASKYNETNFLHADLDWERNFRN